jgi:hypothetical protein
MKERRQIQRLELQAPARIEGVGKSGTTINIQTETKDISSHGAFFLTEEQIEENVNLDIELILSMKKFQELLGRKDQVRLQIRGTVIRSELNGIAVSFSRKYKISVLPPD